MRHAPPPLMLFAAGLGTRMGALTADRPKPLLPVAGRALIDRALDMVADAGITRTVVNLHYKGEMLERHLAGRDLAPSCELSWERGAPLETGGGLRQALPLLGHASPVFTLNPDAIWTGENPVTRLMAEWDDSRMDVLVMLLPAAQARCHAGKDFVLGADGRISRANGQLSTAYLGAQLIRTEGLSDITEPVFSLNRLWDMAIAQGRAYGVIHRGGWCDVGTPEGLKMAEQMLTEGGGDA
ncbi:MAG: nucleotidyltransferase [Rhodobacteraceae bacterium PARR1]|nr:MAG: nucleotidyltransferase [Rhodobacteraceae bacterium PARR1]